MTHRAERVLFLCVLLASACASSTTTAPAKPIEPPRISVSATSAPAGPVAQPTAPVATLPETTVEQTETTVEQTEKLPTQDGGRVEQLTVAIGGDQSSLNPFTVKTAYPGHRLMWLIQEPLLQLDETGSLQNLLTTSFAMSEDGLTYTLELADGVTWHDGKPFTVDDVVFTFDHVVNNDDFDWGYRLRDFDNAQVTGDRTVTIRLFVPNEDFASRVLAELPMLAQHVWSGVTDLANTTDLAYSLGTGPYRLSEYRSGELYKLVAYDAYNRGVPVAKHLDVVIFPDDAASFSALGVGEVDMVAMQVAPQFAQQFASDASITLVEKPSRSAVRLNLNTVSQPFSRVEVRRAISLAIDKQALVDEVLFGRGTAAGASFFHPQSPVAPGVVPSTFDRAAANKILDDLGATRNANGVRELDGQPMSFDVLVLSGKPDQVRTAEVISKMLMEIGLHANVSPVDYDTLRNRVQRGFGPDEPPKFAAAIGWVGGMYQERAHMVRQLVHSDHAEGWENVTGFANTAVDAAVDALHGAGDDVDVVRARAAEFDALFANELPFIMLHYPHVSYAFRSAGYDGWQYEGHSALLNRASLVSTGAATSS